MTVISTLRLEILPLDIGCGTGDLMQDIARAGAYATGIDSSSEMISRAKSKYPEQSFYIADAEDLSAFSSDHYDAVFSNAAFHWMQRPECVLASIYRVLKDRGTPDSGIWRPGKCICHHSGHFHCYG